MSYGNSYCMIGSYVDNERLKSENTDSNEAGCVEYENDMSSNAIDDTPTAKMRTEYDIS